MNRNTAILVLVAAVSLMAGVGLFHLTEPDDAKANLQKPPPALSAIPFTDLQGKASVLGDWQQPLLIINFWAPWCAPCRREIPALVDIQTEFDQQVQVLGLALDSAENVAQFEVENNMNYPSFLAGAQIPMYNAAFNNPSGSLPFTAIIDQQRQLQFFHNGEISAQELRQKINEYL